MSAEAGRPREIVIYKRNFSSLDVIADVKAIYIYALCMNQLISITLKKIN